MIDAKTGGVLFFKNPDIPRPVASTQKLLTALLVAEHGGLDKASAWLLRIVQSNRRSLGSGRVKSIPNGNSWLRCWCTVATTPQLCLARNDAGSVASFASIDERQGGRIGSREQPFRQS